MSYVQQMVFASNGKGEEKVFAWVAPVDESPASFVRRWKRINPGWVLQEILDCDNGFAAYLPQRLCWDVYAAALNEIVGVAA